MSSTEKYLNKFIRSFSKVSDQQSKPFNIQSNDPMGLVSKRGRNVRNVIASEDDTITDTPINRAHIVVLVKCV